MFSLQRTRISADRTRLGAIVFECSVQNRRQRNATLLVQHEEAKRKKIEGLWETVTGFCHLGRHDRSAPVQLTHSDGELAVVSTTILLSYLAVP